MLNEGLMSSESVEWYTPQWLVDRIADEFGVTFTLDVCATEGSAKCDLYYTIEDDGLTAEWVGECWMNPPYGREIGAWMDKARASANDECAVTCLIPARTDTAWWHRNVPFASHVIFLAGRVKFETATGVGASAPFPSAVVRFGGAGHRVQWGLR